MNLIERYFGVSPDGGSGSVEALVFIVMAAIAVVMALHLPGYRTTDRDPLDGDRR